MTGRVVALEPVAVVVLGRGPMHRAAELDPDRAARAIVAGTYAAGELRRYWPLHAVLAMGSGAGPAHPGVHEVAHALTSRLPCFEVDLPPGSTAGPADLVPSEQVKS